MKILLASESFPPNISGVATATQNLAINLTKSGHEAFVFTPGKVLRTQIDKNFPDYTVYRLKSIRNPFRKGFQITFVSEKEIERLLNKIKPDAIHLQDPASIGRVLRDVGRKLGIPVIITNHFSLEYALSYVKFAGFAMPLFRQGLVEYLVSFYNKCDQVVTPTETFRRQIESWGVKTPVCAVSNGIEIEKFLKKYYPSELEKTRIFLHLPNNPLVLYLGRVDKDKSVDVLVRAIPEVIKNVNAHFVIAGSGGEIENLKQLVAELKIDNAVTFLGFLDHNSEDFVKLYKNASIFAIPSTIETQSIVTLEALSSGVPVLAANAGALPELVMNDKDGYLFKPGDSKTLAKYIIKILNNKKLSRKFSEEAVEVAMGHQMKRAFGEMVELYEEVIKRVESGKVER